jgi:tol-pal system protein YbgF
MINHLRIGRFALAMLPPACLFFALALTSSGCGSSEEGTETWEESSQATPPAQSAEFKADSLKNENRRLKDQLDAMAAENRNLTARNAELETKLTESASQPQTITPAPTHTAATASGSSGDQSSAYNAALAKYRSKNFAEAAQDFEALLNSGADEKIAGNCHYWIGESMYGLRKFDDAMKQFETVLGYAGSGKRPAAQFMIGNVYAAQGNKSAAKEAWEKVVSTYPTSDLVEKAKGKIAKVK